MSDDGPTVWIVSDGDDTEPLIDPTRVTDILKDCLFTEDELPEDVTAENLPESAVVAEGIVRPFAFHPGRLEEHRNEVAAMLFNLPTEFQSNERGGGGGWSFLNACQDKNDVQWTGFHQVMDALFVLGIAMKLCSWLLPREIWPSLPGGMPYVVVTG